MKVSVKIKVVPIDPVKELGLDIRSQFLYVLPYHSNIELLILRQQCYLIGLPDPLIPIKINEVKLPAYVFINKKRTDFYYSRLNSYKDIVKTLTTYLSFHYKDPKLNVQMLPVSVMLGRSPGYYGNSSIMKLCLFSTIQKIFTIIWLGRDSFVNFLSTISLHQIANEYGYDKIFVNKLVRVARIYYLRQRLAVVGPKLFTRKKLLKKLLNLKIINKIIEDEVKTKKNTPKKAKSNAIAIIEEIVSNFSYEAIRFADRILGWIWSILYQQINVQYIKNIRYLAQNGNEIVYIPSHRSHMDYLLLSYVLYNQGLVPPHIVAGINLNFWPIGSIFRNLGAFFIRRSFKGNKLYSVIFYEYLNELFTHGFPIEYFIEGGRSRTGRLLEPKTGILSMTVQAMLRNNSRPIAIVPIYIGYEHVLEVTTYADELKGLAKKKEDFFSMLNGLRKLCKLGQGYINFGQPIVLKEYLNKYTPDWHKYINTTDQQRPLWLNSTITLLANKVMVRINDAVAVNATNLSSVALLASRQCILTKKQFIEQIDCYLQILKNVPYSNNSTIPNQTAEQLFNSALKLNIFKVERNFIDDIIVLPRKNALSMSYYRNNIIHLLIFPSLIANIILHNKSLQRQKIAYQVILIYPFLKAELFIRYEIEELPKFIDILLDELVRQQLVLSTRKNFIITNPVRLYQLQLLAASVKETLQRYAVTLSLLNNVTEIKREVLKKNSYIFAQHISLIHGINSLEYFDKTIFSTLINTLKQEGYINEKNNIIVNTTSIHLLYQIITKLISSDINLTIEDTKYVFYATKI